MTTLDDLVHQGKIRYIGCSNYYGWQILKANMVSEKLGKEKFISAQHLYNLVRRDIERRILPALTKDWECYVGVHWQVDF